VTDRESNPRPLGCMSGDSTTHLKRSAVMSGTGIHRLIYRDICVERGASYAACCSQQPLYINIGFVEGERPLCQLSSKRLRDDSQSGLFFIQNIGSCTSALPECRRVQITCGDLESINQSIKSSKRHTSTREATSQLNYTGSKPRDAQRRRLGGLRASRASVSLRDSLFVYTLFTEARKKLPRKTTSDVSSS